MTVDLVHSGVHPDGGIVPARLEFRRSGSHITIKAAEHVGRLCRASFGGPPPKLREHDRTITIEYPLLARAGWVHRTRRAATVTLAVGQPWELVFARGVAHLHVDFTPGELCSLEIAGGVSGAKLRLPAPRGVVPLRISGGARELEIMRPQRSAVRLRIGGGAHRLTLDDQRFGAIGGTTALDTPGAADASDRYEIEIAGGVSHLAVIPEAGSGLVS
jgi:hypothetical protein